MSGMVYRFFPYGDDHSLSLLRRKHQERRCSLRSAHLQELRGIHWWHPPGDRTATTFRGDPTPARACFVRSHPQTI